jgi:hypothetical protein
VFYRLAPKEAHMTRDTYSPSLLNPNHPTPAFEESIMLGAMLATLIVAALGYLLSDDSAVRAQFVLAGLEVILLTLVAGFIASALHAFIAAHKVALRGTRTLGDSAYANL